MIDLSVNGRDLRVDVDDETPLLWVLRDTLGLTGTKFGCGMALCGACTVHLDGRPVRACITPISECAGRAVTTIEGLSASTAGKEPTPPSRHPLQAAWLAENVPQCGWCQSGQIMAAAALLAAVPAPTDDDIDAAMSGNLCRCGTYPRIRRAIQRAAAAGKP
jgi:aerobic-type carbon monoxide dehydrogenase small subunit (CoxS/CutS family)